MPSAPATVAPAQLNAGPSAPASVAPAQLNAGPSAPATVAPARLNAVPSAPATVAPAQLNAEPSAPSTGRRRPAQRLANRLLGDSEKAGLYIDESSFLKKGGASVGVQRQWSGRAGKIENCQVGVFACLGREERMCITDYRLYLPESWVEDETRCRKARIPEEERNYQAKWQQALEMVSDARGQGLEFGWVGVDSLYGSNAKFLNSVEDLGEKFMGDVNRTTKVWCSVPQLEEVPTGAANGRPRKHARLSPDNRAEYVSVEELTSRQFESKHRVVNYRQGHKGKLSTRVWVRKVWCWEKGWDRVRHRLLVVRRDADDSFKYSLTNLPAGRDWADYAWVQGQRFWIEHAFHEAKSQLGMAQYQVRVWRGWHHHMGLVCLALLFTMRTRDELMESAPLLTTRDITELLDFYLPRRNRDEDEVLARIHHRHRKRQEDIDRRRNERTGLPRNLTK